MCQSKRLNYKTRRSENYFNSVKHNDQTVYLRKLTCKGCLEFNTVNITTGRENSLKREAD